MQVKKFASRQRTLQKRINESLQAVGKMKDAKCRDQKGRSERESRRPTLGHFKTPYAVALSLSLSLNDDLYVSQSNAQS